jgi:ABC-type glycerol-3-phosphate transport system substrate-binding protein
MADYQEMASTYNISDDVADYQTYLSTYPGVDYATQGAEADAGSFVRYEEGGTAVEPMIYTDFEGMEGDSVLTGEDSLIEWEVEVEETGLYHMEVLYYPVAGKNSDIQRSVFVDGKLPYEEMYMVSFNRVWANYVANSYVNEDGITVKEWEKDNQGNDIKPEGIEIPQWQTKYLYDNKGYITAPLALYLEKGTHTITLLSLKEPMLIRKISLNTQGDTKGYEEVKAGWDAIGGKDTSGSLITIEGEYADKMSSQMLYPKQNQSSPAVSPSSSKELLNNTIGGESWRLVGQWLEWEFEVKETGYYQIAMYDRQHIVRGIDVSRRITIDGEVPFTEMSAYAFSYAQNFRQDVLSDEEGNAYRFYLTEGTHTIRMEAVLGEFSEVVGSVEDAVRQLNDIYRSVIMITGVKPDTYRDYQIAAMLPGLGAQMVQVRDILNEALERLEVIAGKNTDKKAVLLSMRDQLNKLIEDEEYFVRGVEQFRINLRACGNWITQVISQPLEIDRIFVYSPDTKPKYEHTSIFSKIGYEVARLYYSFIIDYNQIGNVEEDKDQAALTLWVGTGRDQANIIKSLVDESFTRDTGISVNVQLVDMTTLLKASLVGQGPDVAVQVANTNGIAGAVLNTGNDTPVNYGIRNAVLNLAEFNDLPEVSQRYPEAALTQFSYDGAVYALPETITYPVMFYRKDILAEIGLEIPKTWNDVKVAMSVLAKNQMEFGMLPNEQLFASLLYQNGGSYYQPDALASALDSDVSVNTFKSFCELYSDYKLDKDISVEERFRTGECPLMIGDYTIYNNFAVSAPDIAGLWGFTMIPGTIQPDGTVDHSVACTGLASMIMANTAYPEESWELLKWWTSAETQTRFGNEMERLMGAAARVPTANYEAFLNMPWPVADFEALKESMAWAEGIPQIPGGYYSWRNVNNAFWSVVVTNPDTSSPREELMDQVIYINAEIAYKQEELQLNRK